MAFSVLLDANVLFPIRLTDLLLTAADARLYRPLWSEQVLDEACRNAVAEYGPAISSRFDKMRAAYPQAAVTGYEPLVSAMTNHLDDRHVLAAAVAGRADLIVTYNKRHFPAASRTPFQIDLQGPNEFLEHLWSLNQNAVIGCIETIARKRRRPPASGGRHTGTSVASELIPTVPGFANVALASGLLSS